MFEMRECRDIQIKKNTCFWPTYTCKATNNSNIDVIKDVSKGLQPTQTVHQNSHPPNNGQHRHQIPKQHHHIQIQQSSINHQNPSTSSKKGTPNPNHTSTNQNQHRTPPKPSSKHLQHNATPFFNSKKRRQQFNGRRSRPCSLPKIQHLVPR